jgi:hypothetical protein
VGAEGQILVVEASCGLAAFELMGSSRALVGLDAEGRAAEGVEGVLQAYLQREQ